MTRFPAPRHAPQGTLVHAIVQAHFEGWLEYRKQVGRPVPRHVQHEFLEYLDCGDPEHGFTILACPGGHYSRYVAQRCKGRGFCAYCLTIRQRELAHHLIERVIGNVPVRHVVLCFPPQLRCVLVYDEALLNGGFKVLAEAIFAYQRRKAAELLEVPEDRIHPGGVEANHRTSANLEANNHFHGIFPDGVFVELEPGGELVFRRLPPPTEEDIAVIAYEAGLAFCEVLKARGFWETTSASSDTVEGKLKLPNRKPCRAKFFGQAAKDSEGGVAPRDGAYAFHLFVGNAIEVEERPQLDHLVNYILAPPFKDGQVHLDAEGNVVLWLKRNRHDGTPYVVFTPYQFLDRLADLVPRRRTNTLRYYGVYAPRARHRKAAISLRLDGSQPIARRATGLMVCPICSQRLRVVAEVKGRRRTTGAIPPDTPRTVTPREGDRMGKRTVDEGQGRLFD